MSEAIELYKQDGTTAGVFYCSDCHRVYSTKKDAEWCHGERICACGKKIETNYRHKCEACDISENLERAEKNEAKRFEKAKKITETEYTGDHVYCGDQYYESVEDAIDQYDEGQEPEYVWACTKHGIDLEDCTTNIIDNMWDDAETSDLNGIDELEEALAAFNKANESIQLWEPDYSTAIWTKPMPYEDHPSPFPTGVEA